MTFKKNMLQSYDTFTQKVLEHWTDIDNSSSSGIDLPLNSFLTYKPKSNSINIYYVDFMISELKKRRNINFVRGFTPMERLFDSQNRLKDENFVFIREFALMLFRENEAFITEGKLARIATRLNELMLKKHAFKCFIEYFFIILLQKNSFTNFSPMIVEILEDWIMNNIAYLSENGKTDESSVFALLFITFEIFCWNFKTGVLYFSLKFMKFFTSLGIWHTQAFWEKSIILCKQFFGGKENCFYVNLLKTKTTKSRIKSLFSVYKMLIFMSFCFLKIPLWTVLDIFNHINDKLNHVSVNQIFDLSRAIEPRMFEKAKLKIPAFSERSIFFKKDSTSTMFVVKKSIDFLSDPKDCFQLVYLNRDFYNYLKAKLLKQLLMADKIKDQLRIRLWIEISRVVPSGKSLVQELSKGELDHRILHIIKMDVKRTNFAKFNKESLEKLLLEIAAAFPLTTYYQGMNCIGGFLLNFTDNYDTSFQVFNYLMKKRLEVYFLNNFEKLKKLLYISERIIQIYVPNLNARFEELKIGIEFYISPILLTIFTSSLQFIENYSLISKIMDVFISKGWVGFFKVMVYLFRILEKKIIEKDYDKALEFLNKGIYESLFKIKLENLKSECDKILIFNKQVYQLGIEFDCTRLVVENYWNNYYESKRKAKD